MSELPEGLAVALEMVQSELEAQAEELARMHGRVGGSEGKFFRAELAEVRRWLLNCYDRIEDAKAWAARGTVEWR